MPTFRNCTPKSDQSIKRTNKTKKTKTKNKLRANSALVTLGDAGPSRRQAVLYDQTLRAHSGSPFVLPPSQRQLIESSHAILDRHFTAATNCATAVDEKSERNTRQKPASVGPCRPRVKVARTEAASALPLCVVLSVPRPIFSWRPSEVLSPEPVTHTRTPMITVFVCVCVRMLSLSERVSMCVSVYSHMYMCVCVCVCVCVCTRVSVCVRVHTCACAACVLTCVHLHAGTACSLHQGTNSPGLARLSRLGSGSYLNMVQ